jgi:RimJ/RimL family protein N-acetyltransferase
VRDKEPLPASVFRPLSGDVQLREVAEGDLPILFEHQRDPEANRMAAFPARGREAFMAHWRKILSDERIITRTVTVDGQVAGNLVCFEESGRQEVGYWIGREYWGRGVATQALAAFLGQVTTRPLYAGVARHNAASIRVLEKCGFTMSDEGGGSSNGDDVEEYLLELRT